MFCPKFHEDLQINSVFQQTITIFKLSLATIKTNVRIKFHKDWTMSVTSKPCKENAPSLGGNNFQRNGTIFEITIHGEIPLPLGSNVFQQTRTICDHIQDIIKTNILTKCHEDWKIPILFYPTRTIFNLGQDMIGAHILIKFHKDWPINMAFRVFTRKTATPPVNVDNAQRTTQNRQKAIAKARHEHVVLRGAPGLVMGPCIVEIDHIVIRDDKYQFEVNRCRNEEVNFQGSSANSVGGDSGQDGRTDEQTAEITT
ncbi:hypothetical protein DPMN_059659 [Dreissena polymorpha]|uniref:Uncharacterized protein n=1 Tax=Dreissena polymorpha TaxID=45954 RepID=A0A9D4C4G7_DREPO|nr:hypothetical protein DPMN_059659 [Dreissena polymorpha]